MKVSIHAVGRMKAGPDRELAERYIDRFAKSAPGLGLDFSGVTEIAESRLAQAPDRQRKARQDRDPALPKQVEFLPVYDASKIMYYST